MFLSEYHKTVGKFYINLTESLSQFCIINTDGKRLEKEKFYVKSKAIDGHVAIIREIINAYKI